jgi:hypothetical protein
VFIRTKRSEIKVGKQKRNSCSKFSEKIPVTFVCMYKEVVKNL